MPNTFLVTGGAGFLGINLVRHLLAKAQRVVSLDVVTFDYPEERGRIIAVQGDIRRAEDVRRALKGADIVAHAAAALPLYDPADIYSTNVHGTHTVMKESLRAGIERVIHISSTAVNSIPNHHPIKENDELTVVGRYGKATVKAEEICEQYGSRGLCLPLLRPKSFFGPDDWESLPCCTSGPAMPATFNPRERQRSVPVSPRGGAERLDLAIRHASGR